jgi:hypothetical protein
LAIDAVDDIDECLDITLWSTALAAPMVPISRIEADRGKRENFIAESGPSPPSKKPTKLRIFR